VGVKELRLKKPVMVVYCDYHPPGPGGRPITEIELKVATISTFKEAADLEHQVAYREHASLQDGNYHPLITPSHGSIALQLVAALYKELGQAEEIELRDPVEDVKARHEVRPDWEIPDVVTQQWLLQLLSNELKLPGEYIDLQSPEWQSAQLAYLPSMAGNLIEEFGASAKGDLIHAIVSAAKRLYQQMSPMPLAVGVHETKEFSESEQAELEMLRVYFKVRTVDMTPKG
jgi:hypothetical protein